MSLPLEAVRRLLPLLPRSTESALSLHQAIRSRKGEAPVTDAVRRVATVAERSVEGFRVVTLTPKRPSGAHLIYTHGGCYTFPLRGLHWGFWRGSSLPPA